jgi:hypothetical protein
MKSVFPALQQPAHTKQNNRQDSQSERPIGAITPSQTSHCQLSSRQETALELTQLEIPNRMKSPTAKDHGNRAVSKKHFNVVGTMVSYESAQHGYV